MYRIFLLLCSFKSLIGSPQSNGEDEILSLPAPSTESDIIYKLERDNIMSFFRDMFKSGTKFSLNSARYRFELAMQHLLNNLNTKELLKAMMQDNSGYFLSIFWIGFQRFKKDLEFKRTNTLYSLNFPYNEMSDDDVKVIFNMFRSFVFRVFAEAIHSCGTDSAGSSESYDLLCIFQMFWYNKLEHMGKKLLKPIEFKGEREMTEERFRFLERFLSNDPKVQIIWEYKRLRQVSREPNISPFALERFYFLAQHLEFRLRKLDFPEFFNDLEWLASQSPLFLAYFFYFLEFLILDREPPKKSFLAFSYAKMLHKARKSVNFFIYLKQQHLFVFSSLTYASAADWDEAARLSLIILAKLGIKPDISHEIKHRLFTFVKKDDAFE